MYSPATTKLLSAMPAVMNMARRVAIQAGEKIMAHYDPSGFQGDVQFKADDSPVTLADVQADDMIRAGLEDLMPGIPMITEETVHDRNHDHLKESDYFWLVDGLDGTKAFRKGNPDFTVNIALVHHDIPVMGLIYAPALGEGYMGCAGTAYKWRDETGKDEAIHVRRVPANGLILLSGVTDHISARRQTLIDQVKVNRHIKRHSSIKFCEIAAGRADIIAIARDIYFWDSAAGDAILRAAGGHLVGWDGQPLRYDRNDPDLINRGAIGCNDLDYIRPILDEMALSEYSHLQN